MLTLARLAKRETPLHALSGLIGVAFAAFIATRSGRAENFFLPGLLANAAYAAAFLISIAVKHPLVGLIVANLDGEGSAWRRDPQRARAFVLAIVAVGGAVRAAPARPAAAVPHRTASSRSAS